LGYGEQRDRRGQEERLRERQEDQPELVPQGREKRWPCIGLPVEVVSVGCSPQGCFDPPAQIRRGTKEHQPYSLQQQPQTLQREQSLAQRQPLGNERSFHWKPQPFQQCSATRQRHS
jgi:hypothetical protein